MFGKHLIKSWASNQAVVALSSGEAEYYAIVKASSQAIGIKNMMEDLGEKVEASITVKTDASAAIGMVSRIVVGKVRHIEVNQLWLQEKSVHWASGDKESGYKGKLGGRTDKAPFGRGYE